MINEIYTSEGWVAFNGSLDGHLCMETGCGLPATQVVNGGRSPETRLPILWAMCAGCGEECGAEQMAGADQARREGYGD